MMKNYNIVVTNNRNSIVKIVYELNNIDRLLQYIKQTR